MYVYVRSADVEMDFDHKLYGVNFYQNLGSLASHLESGSDFQDVDQHEKIQYRAAVSKKLYSSLVIS